MNSAFVVDEVQSENKNFRLNSEELRAIKVQRFLGWLCVLALGFVIVFVLRFVYRLRIKNLPQIRKRFREIASSSKRPLLICANHLTMIDSVLIIRALRSIPGYFFDYRLLSWNIPAVENYTKRLRWKVTTYLSKCIPIDRMGNSEHVERVLEKVRYLLKKGDICTIFPEGGRSRSGRIETEKVTYGIGKIATNLSGCDVLCVYLRGDHQVTYSRLPKRGDSIYLDMEVITPICSEKGLRAVRDFSLQTIQKLKQMEDRYFGLSGNG